MQSVGKKKRNKRNKFTKPFGENVFLRYSASRQVRGRSVFHVFLFQFNFFFSPFFFSSPVRYITQSYNMYTIYCTHAGAECVLCVSRNISNTRTHVRYTLHNIGQFVRATRSPFMTIFVRKRSGKKNTRVVGGPSLCSLYRNGGVFENGNFVLIRHRDTAYRVPDKT